MRERNNADSGICKTMPFYDAHRVIWACVIYNDYLQIPESLAFNARKAFV